MNVQEQHIDIDLAIQKINANYYRQLTAEEKDWLLNKHVGRFIKDRIKQDTDSLGFDATEVDMDALRALLVLDRELATFHVEDDAIRGELPGDYSYLIDDFSNTIDKCDTVNYKAGTTFVNTTIYIYTFPLIQSVTTTPFYKAISLKLNNTDVFNVINLPGLATAGELFTVRDYILSQLFNYVRTKLQDNPAFNVDFYWERFGSYYSPNSFLAISTTQQSSTNSITIDGTTTAATESTITRNFVPEIDGKLCANRLVRGHFRSNLRSSAFAKTTANSPISAVNANQLKVYSDKKFIISKLKVSYIRKPAKISLSLNQNCDIAEEFHNEINDRVILDIKELIMAPDWEIKLRDMMMNKD